MFEPEFRLVLKTSAEIDQELERSHIGYLAKNADTDAVKSLILRLQEDAVPRISLPPTKGQWR